MSDIIRLVESPVPDSEFPLAPGLLPRSGQVFLLFALSEAGGWPGLPGRCASQQCLTALLPEVIEARCRQYWDR